MTSVLFSLANSKIDFAIFTLSSSILPSPTEYPRADKNIMAIPPPTTSKSNFSNIFCNKFILSAIFAPPMIAAIGLAGSSKAALKFLNSFSIWKPA